MREACRVVPVIAGKNFRFYYIAKYSPINPPRHPQIKQAKEEYATFRLVFINQEHLCFSISTNFLNANWRLKTFSASASTFEYAFRTRINSITKWAPYVTSPTKKKPSAVKPAVELILPNVSPKKASVLKAPPAFPRNKAF